MKAATIHELKRALTIQDPKKIMALCLRLARYKKENKELLTYLLFEADDEASYVNSLKSELDEQMKEVRKPSLYLTKKSLRKVLRFLDKFIRYSGNKETETELRIYFCQKMRDEHIPIHRSRILTNLYDRQLKKIETAMSKLHEDLQFDYKDQLEDLR